LITQRLLALGHQRFGVIFQTQQGNSRVQARLKAIDDTLAKNGIAVRPQHFAMLDDNGSARIQFARQAFRRLMAAEPAPTAIICGNDTLAIGALLEAKAIGLDVPGVVSITGCDDIELADQLHPPLTTVRVPDREMGRLAAEYLIDRIAGKSPERPAMLEATLIERDSTGPVPAGK
jgi:LacI family transcriptional regulator